MAGRFEHFETQMVEQEDQNRLLEAKQAIRQEARQQELREFQQARSAATSASAPPVPTVMQPAKISPKAKPKLPSFVPVERKRPHSEVDQPSASDSAAAQLQAAPKAAAPETAAAKAQKPSVVSSLVAYGDSDDDEEAEG
jgi:hypothetical protein